MPGKSHGRRSLVGFSPWGREESDTTERLDFHFSPSHIGAGNGNPLQYSCLENPREGRAWWAAVYGVAQSRTQLKRLSSSSSSRTFHSKTINFTFFSSAHGTFSRIDHILGHKSSLDKLKKKNEIISSIFSDHNAVRLDINYRGKKKTLNIQAHGRQTSHF